MKFDITIKDTDGNVIAEYIVGEQTKDFVIRGCEVWNFCIRHPAALKGVDQGDGHEVPKEDIA